MRALAVREIRSKPFGYEIVIDEICRLSWEKLTKDQLVDVAWAYYYFSIQFRENLEIAYNLYPGDLKLGLLMKEECNTDNLSPWTEVASIGEKINHDEFMRRLLKLSPICQVKRRRLTEIGQLYLNKVHRQADTVRASSISSYEDGGLERVFRAILVSPDWNSPLLEAFKYFLTEHIRLDNDPQKGHGALCRHLRADDHILPLWTAFKDILIEAAPALTS
jgi:hypothetical protein